VTAQPPEPKQGPAIETRRVLQQNQGKIRSDQRMVKPARPIRPWTLLLKRYSVALRASLFACLMVNKMATKVAAAINCSRQAQIRSKKFFGSVREDRARAW
jgi:hypothetical protein